MTVLGHPPAAKPEDLGRMFIERANAKDLDGLVSLYERDAVLVAGLEIARGIDAIRTVLERFVTRMATENMTFEGEPTFALVSEDLALTSIRYIVTTVDATTGKSSVRNGISAEACRQQPDGSWLFAVVQPNIAG